MQQIFVGSEAEPGQDVHSGAIEGAAAEAAGIAGGIATQELC